MDNSSIFQKTIILVPIFSIIILLYSFSNLLKNKNVTKIPEASGWVPILGHLHRLGGPNPVARTLGAMADRHGPIFSLRLGCRSRAIVVSGPGPIRECLSGENDRLFADRPENIAVAKYIGYDGAAFAVSRYGKYWRDVRKFAAVHLLSGGRLHSLSAARVSEIDSFVRGLVSVEGHSLSHVVVDLGEALEKATFDLNARLIVGKRCKSSGESVRRFRRALKEALYLSGVFVWSDVMPWIEVLDVHGHVASMKRVFKELDSVLGEWLEDHRRRVGVGPKESESESERDLIDVMLERIEDDDDMLDGFSRDIVIKATALILMLTGTESTSVTITWAISLLLNNPTVLRSLRQELDVHVGTQRWAQESDLKTLSLLKAVVKETLRLYPPGPIAGPRVATQDCHVAGHAVPRGTRLIVNIWRLHRDPQIWADPNEFRPERFLSGPSEPQEFGYGYLPFGSGRRSCPGMGLGTLVVELILARLVQGFEIRTENGKQVDMSEGLGIALPKLNPLKLILSPRLPKHLYV